MEATHMKAFTAVVLLTIASVAHAQAKPHEQQKPQVWKDKPQGQQQQGKGQVNHWNASAATKEMLMRHGYRVVAAEQFEDGNALYFRRGDVLRASDVRIEKAVIRKGASSVEFDGVPREVLVDVKAKLGM
jgi:flagellar biosynthesis component FlhA